MTARSVASDAQASSCSFRTTTDGHYRKALVQIDERCNCIALTASSPRPGTAARCRMSRSLAC